jgi:5-methylcytosine-specific restriction endonuclease McrA
VDRPTRPCPTPGCPHLTDRAKGCPTCRTRDGARRTYDSHWEALALAHRMTHPVCEVCRTRRATQTHHKGSLATDPHRRLDPTNLLAVCAGCHRVLTPTTRPDAGHDRRRRR